MTTYAENREALRKALAACDAAGKALESVSAIDYDAFHAAYPGLREAVWSAFDDWKAAFHAAYPEIAEDNAAHAAAQDAFDATHPELIAAWRAACSTLNAARAAFTATHPELNAAIVAATVALKSAYYVWNEAANC